MCIPPKKFVYRVCIPQFVLYFALRGYTLTRSLAQSPSCIVPFHLPPPLPVCTPPQQTPRSPPPTMSPSRSPGAPQRLNSLHAFEKMELHFIRPMLSQLGDKLKTRNSDELMDWFRVYRAEVDQLCALYAQVLRHRTHAYNARLKGALNDLCPALRASPLLSQKALRAVVHSGVDHVVCDVPSPTRYKALVQYHDALGEAVGREDLRALMSHPDLKYDATSGV